MPTSPSTAKELLAESLGYTPLRMKPVHLATSFLLCLHGSYRRLELLNKVSNPKATEKRPGDEYVAENLLTMLQEDGDESPLGADVDINALRVLRSHLNVAYNNDGAALAAGFPPYSTFGHDYSAPSTTYLSNWSKNHGNAGCFIYLVMMQTSEGREFLSLARDLFESAGGPLHQFGKPLVREEPIAWEYEPKDIMEHLDDERIQQISTLMMSQTCALNLLVKNLKRKQSPYMLRQLIIGIGSWLLAYHVKHAQTGSDTLFFFDFVGECRSRVRTQAASCYSRSMGLFGHSCHRWATSHPELGEDVADVLRKNEKNIIKELEDHFRDFAVRIGWVQPRSGTHQKYFRPTPDSLRVILLSILDEQEICSSAEVAARLRDRWHWVIGLLPEDHQTLRSHGFSPLDEDADLRANRHAFHALAVKLGLAWKPSDGLVLFSLNPNLHS